MSTKKTVNDPFFHGRSMKRPLAKKMMTLPAEKALQLLILLEIYLKRDPNIEGLRGQERK